MSEAYLCCICLMNITYLEDAIDEVLNFVPVVDVDMDVDIDDPSNVLTGNENVNDLNINVAARSRSTSRSKQRSLPFGKLRNRSRSRSRGRSNRNHTIPSINTVRSSSNGRTNSTSRRRKTIELITWDQFTNSSPSPLRTTHTHSSTPLTITRNRSSSSNHTTHAHSLTLTTPFNKHSRVSSWHSISLVPSPSTLIDDPNSLLRTIERMMQHHKPFLLSQILSVEGEAVRWAIGLLRNLTKCRDHCAPIIRTNIPGILVEIIRDTPRPVCKWVEDSLEEMALLVLSRLPCCEEGREALFDCRAVDVVTGIIGEGGVHETRANSILMSLGIV